VFDDKLCTKRGPHYCEPRADRVVAFFAELLVHTKGRWARNAFVLEPWQEHDIVRPLFGEVLWSPAAQRYVRRYKTAVIVIARKNGKSELAAGIVLYLLVGDDEEGAEIYGGAKDTKQADKVGQVVRRMRELSATLEERLGYNKHEKRVYDEQTDSFYEIIPSDAEGELGSNPHGFVLDEVLSQPDGSLWDAQRTAAGTRDQPLFLLITTETNRPVSFGAGVIDEAERIAEQPKRNPHTFVYVRKLPRDDKELALLRKVYAGEPDLPVSCDPWDERNWYWPNPALGTFLNIDALRQDALEARNDPTKENGFRQFRLNQRMSQVTRHMPLLIWDACGRELLSKVEKTRGRCFGGLDLASAIDLAALTWLFPGTGTEDDPHRMVWRFWTTEAQVPVLSRHTGGQFEQWVNEGLVRVTEGDWIDYDEIRKDLARDLKRLDVVHLFYDPAMAPDTAQWLIKRGVNAEPHKQGYSMSPPLNELSRLAKLKGIEHGGHPVARWNADCVAVMSPRDDPDTIKIVKPNRAESTSRIDGYASAAMAISSYLLYGTKPDYGAATAAAAGDEDRTVYTGGRLEL